VLAHKTIHIDASGLSAYTIIYMYFILIRIHVTRCVHYDAYDSAAGGVGGRIVQVMVELVVLELIAAVAEL